MTNQQLKAHCEDVIANPQDHLDWVVDMAKEALAALTQPASPDFKLPDGWVAVPREATIEMIESGWTYSVLEKNATAKGTWACMVAAAPAVPHTAPIEPICATGGAEWVKFSEQDPPHKQYVLAADFSGLRKYSPCEQNPTVAMFGDWFDDGKPTWDDGDGGDIHLMHVTHWMALPAAPI